MRKKVVKLVLYFSVEIESITRENVDADLRQYACYKEMVEDPETWERAERQRSLMDLFVGDNDLLNEFIKRLVVEAVEPERTGELHSIFAISECGQELESLVDKLPDDDAEFFYRAIDAEVFYESTEHILNRIQPKLAKATIKIDDVE